jgi:hypothetical protein
MSKAEGTINASENKKFFSRRKLMALGLLAAATAGCAAPGQGDAAAPQSQASHSAEATPGPASSSPAAAPEQSSPAYEATDEMDAEARQFASQVLATVSEQVYSSPEEFNRTEETYDGVLMRSVTRSAESYADQTFTYSVEYIDGTPDSSPDNIAAVRLDVQHTDLSGNPQTDYYFSISNNGGRAQVTAQGDGWNAFGDFGGYPQEGQDSDTIGGPDQLQSILDQAEQIANLGAGGGKLNDAPRPY